MYIILISLLLGDGGVFPIPQEYEYSWNSNSSDCACDMVATIENDGYIICGYTWDTSQDVSDPHVYVIRIDNSGNLVWSNRYYLNSASYGLGICKSRDGTDRYCIVGETTSSSGIARQLYFMIDGTGAMLHDCNGPDGRLYDVVSTIDGAYYATGYDVDHQSLVRCFTIARNRWLEDCWPTQSQFDTGYDIDCIPSPTMVTAVGYGWSSGNDASEQGANRAGWFKRFSNSGGITGPYHEEDIQAQLYSIIESTTGAEVAGRAIGTNRAYLARYVFKNWQYQLAYEHEFTFVSDEWAEFGDIDRMPTGGTNYLVGYGLTGTVNFQGDMFIAWFREDTGNEIMSVVGGGPDNQSWGGNHGYGCLGGDFISGVNWATAATSVTGDNWDVRVMIMPWFDISQYDEANCCNLNDRTDCITLACNCSGNDAYALLQTDLRGTARIITFDITGRLICSNTQISICEDQTVLSIEEITGANQPNGIYFLQVELNGNTASTKWINMP